MDLSSQQLVENRIEALLGRLTLQNIALGAEVEALRATVAKLQAEASAAPKPEA